MFRDVIKPAIVLLFLFTLLTGIAYPLVVTAIAQVVFPYRANGSILRDAEGKPRGSELLGQQFDQPKHFWGRLSATGPVPYTGFNAEKLTGSSGSNYGPLNPALKDAMQARIDALTADEPDKYQPIPVDLVTASGSGLDPHISPAAAAYQVARVAKSRGMSEDEVREIVARHTQGRTFGVLGEPRVNVLELNLDLDKVSTP